MVFSSSTTPQSQCPYLADHIDAAHTVTEGHAVELVCVAKQLGPEGRGYKLGFGRKFVDHIGDSCAVGCIQVRVDFVKQVEGSRVTLLNLLKWRGRDELDCE